ncbi:putative GTPase [Acidibacillus sp. S0AB]|uniref:GTPase n=1 Tax=Sulfoacidibacillus ferrooxidans TaxID=2005001 RepID=A0A9X2AC06_9BACL|nr:methylmalonyl Co-A mutase-associated GTPase MeaB [Sulfoacidibacillus ferrooxidans]MCI0183339.1 putative GTPase [Sulfoacidibacillus ferrooxidans]
MATVEQFVKEIARGNTRAIARAISYMEEGGEPAQELLSMLNQRAHAGIGPHIMGITGAPGAGKSSLTDQLLTYLRSCGKRIAVIAVDPSSPFTGGAVLGDRVRMNRHALDPLIFIRSMGTRGSGGGLSRSVRHALQVLYHAPFDVILLETVGVGQAELDIVYVADTVTVVLTPSGGDEVQAAKAGLMEIGDVFLVNKADLPGSANVAKDVQEMLHVTEREDGWDPPVLLSSAVKNDGVKQWWDACEEHFAHLLQEHRLVKRRGRARVQAMHELLQQGLWREMEHKLHEDDKYARMQEQVEIGDRSPEAAVSQILMDIFKSTLRV